MKKNDVLAVHFRRRPGAAGLEDGTPAYLAIASLAHGFAQLNKLGSFPAIEQHTATLTRWVELCILSILLQIGPAIVQWCLPPSLGP